MKYGYVVSGVMRYTIIGFWGFCIGTAFMYAMQPAPKPVFVNEPPIEASHWSPTDWDEYEASYGHDRTDGVVTSSSTHYATTMACGYGQAGPVWITPTGR